MKCGKCGGTMLGGEKIDEAGRKFFGLKEGEEICFWCIESYNYDPYTDPPLLQGHA